MDRTNIILLSLLLCLQTHILPVQCDSIIGYTVADGTTETFSCPSPASFRTTHTFSGDTDTYAHCDYFTAEAGSSFEYRVGTYCDGNTALFTHWTAEGSGTSSSMISDGDCVAVRLYDYHDDLEGLRWLVSCNDSIGVPTSISTLFMEHPTDWETETESSTTESESLITVTVGASAASSTETETSPSATVPSRPSEPEETESSTEEVTKDGGGPSGGVIAGAVVGSIAGVAFIIGAIILAFRMGRRSRDDTEGPDGGFRDSMRFIPMPTAAGNQPEPKPPVPVIQPVFVQDSHLSGNNS
ncbi:uncharacterized protein BKA55DRAFT_543759 [Fusarium redolens]|uniref:Uncharacterized protein n=1 Tax=Fusarium redolens TaxID=48865 RepID=A0A9P9GEN1_FUSRE|nr:uncharacterized protein BKA55DRAFT_543759 [Fusarium redolens]KAH7237122.1 hypothetical protein BKA55DRAFT_543759 [Fusarium redolens]